MKKILVTGGAGFIGGNFIHHLLANDPDVQVCNLDLLTYAGDLTKHAHLAGDRRYRFFQRDIADRYEIEALFARESFDAVVHFAAESHVDRSIADPQSFVRTNVVGTQVLLEASRINGVAKFVHVSTDEVYGELSLEGDELFTEQTPINPNSPYSASKAASDLLTRSYYETYGMPVCITRCSNNYGPYHFPEKLIPLTISKAVHAEKIPVYGDGRNIRDWLHVFDHCAALDLVLRKGEAGEVYNIGGRNERSNLEVVNSVLALLGNVQEMIEFVKDRPGHDQRYAIDPTKIEALGWKPRYAFEEGLKQTVEWYQENEDWWRNVLTQDDALLPGDRFGLESSYS
ncbi:dTDP-glucose 4,6-dehydratase [Planomicrobium sp. YIM 101495]|uniref:dTDP-glucose 4,6-dehydratase n=1 Tax=Planomicrobium sp. YIM 101495 TaxID=2665160 RepID=UPI0012B7E043|nr:dTDP-glucose 4,6-dehydratase [Planomicrobium sp. YIM 101495]MTD30563.1 dTDP-glucose 4,6-dehydratase [Planomicrobium sp. YIM 101495]